MRDTIPTVIFPILTIQTTLTTEEILMGNVNLLDPLDHGSKSAKYPAPRLDTLNGKTMGLLNIGKNGSDVFLERVEELICGEFDVAEVVHVNKPTFTRPAPDELIIQLANRCDFVIEGLAD